MRSLSWNIFGSENKEQDALENICSRKTFRLFFVEASTCIGTLASSLQFLFSDSLLTQIVVGSFSSLALADLNSFRTPTKLFCVKESNKYYIHQLLDFMSFTSSRQAYSGLRKRKAKVWRNLLFFHY